jgi:hypothetical protein
MYAPLACVQYIRNLSCGLPSSTTYHSYMENKQILPPKKYIERHNQPKTHKIRFNTTTQYRQENKTVFKSTKLTQSTTYGSQREKGFWFLI